MWLKKKENEEDYRINIVGRINIQQWCNRKERQKG